MNQGAADPHLTLQIVSAEEENSTDMND